MSGVALVVLVLVAAAMAGIYLVQRSMMFPGGMRSADRAAIARHPGLESSWIEIAGARVETWFAPARGHGDGRSRPLVIFAHGNGELIDDWPEALAGFAERGIHLLLVEYPGYGRSTGRSSQASISAVMLAAYDAAVTRPGVDRDRVVLYGRSLGGAAVCSLLGRRSVAALILQSSFTSVTALAREAFLLPAFLVRDAFDNLSAVEAYTGPVLVVHGTSDTIIPHAHGVALSRAASRGRLISYRCGHNDCPPSWRRFWTDVDAFLIETGISGS